MWVTHLKLVCKFTARYMSKKGLEATMNREQAWSIVTEYTQGESLRRHMLAVETAMRAYASRFGGDPEVWGVTGLVHDFDYERYPDVAVEGHPVVGSKILREQGVSEDIIKAVLA